MMLNNLSKVMEGYKPDESIWREYSDDVLMLKRAMNNLGDGDRVIFLLYCEYGSLRKVAKQLGVSHSIIYKNIKRIKLEMYDYIKSYSDSSNSSLCDRLSRVCRIPEEETMEMVEE